MSAASSFAGSALTLLLVSYGWIWFRSSDTQTALTITGKLCQIPLLFVQQGKAVIGEGDFSFLATMGLLLLVCTGGPLAVQLFEATFPALPRWVKVQAATAVFVLCYVFAGTESKPFIYFQF